MRLAEPLRGAAAQAPCCCLPWTYLKRQHPHGTHYPGPGRARDGSTRRLQKAEQASLGLDKRHVHLHRAWAHKREVATNAAGYLQLGLLLKL